MADVFEATLVGAEGFSRPVALKRIRADLSADPHFGKMFVSEARIASLLNHPNIVAVLDFDRDDRGNFYLVMERVHGKDLREIMNSGDIPVEIATFIAGEMLRGLAYAHELEESGRPLGIVHRDISPHNVLVSWDGAVKVGDFGIAKAFAATGATRSKTVKGKVAYMSPEQARAEELDGRSDLFAVGVTLHELLSGGRLFGGSTEAEVLAHMLAQPIPRPRELNHAVPEDLDAVVMALLERDRDQRFFSARAALEALLQCSSVSPRASLSLASLLAGRFPEAGVKSADPRGVHGPTAQRTQPAAPGSQRAAMAAQTRTAQAEVRAGGTQTATPTAAGEQAGTPSGASATWQPRRGPMRLIGIGTLAALLALAAWWAIGPRSAGEPNQQTSPAVSQPSFRDAAAAPTAQVVGAADAGAAAAERAAGEAADAGADAADAAGAAEARSARHRRRRKPTAPTEKPRDRPAWEIAPGRDSPDEIPVDR